MLVSNYLNCTFIDPSPLKYLVFKLNVEIDFLRYENDCIRHGIKSMLRKNNADKDSVYMRQSASADNLFRVSNM